MNDLKKQFSTLSNEKLKEKHEHISNVYTHDKYLSEKQFRNSMNYCGTDIHSDWSNLVNILEECLAERNINFSPIKKPFFIADGHLDMFDCICLIRGAPNLLVKVPLGYAFNQKQINKLLSMSTENLSEYKKYPFKALPISINEKIYLTLQIGHENTVDIKLEELRKEAVFSVNAIPIN
ncbi:hypothetical protein ACIPUA_10305 [Providencia sp. AGC89]